MKASYDWLKSFVDCRLKPEALAALLTQGGLEVETIEGKGENSIFTFGVTPNRPDCLSVMGIAREIAALSQKKFRGVSVSSPQGTGKIADAVSVRVEAPTLCPRYAARVIDGVNVGSSPQWLKKRLEAAGLRPINNIVDATNMVMWEVGQPLHAFDARFLTEKKICVRRVGKKELFTTLDGIKRELHPDDLVIADGKGTVAIAGVMGGANSEVRNDTTRVVLESAYFQPTSIRRTSKRLGLSTESSRRFERGIDPNGTVDALHRVTQLILDIAGGKPSSDIIDLYPKKISPSRMLLSCDEIERILGLCLPTQKMISLLGRLGIVAIKKQTRAVLFEVPTVRPDLARPIDLIEEIARLVGYDRIVSTLPAMTLRPVTGPVLLAQATRVRSTLFAQGFSEAVVTSFEHQTALNVFGGYAGEPIRVLNPLSEDHGWLRTTLLAGLFRAAVTNAFHQQHDCRLFSLQRVFARGKNGSAHVESWKIAGVLCGKRFPKGWQASSPEVDLYDVKGVVESLGEALGFASFLNFDADDALTFAQESFGVRVRCGNNTVGFLGKLHPHVAEPLGLRRDLFFFELDVEKLPMVSEKDQIRFSPLPRYPFVERDISLLVEDKVHAADLESTIYHRGGKDLVSVKVFDVYRGKGIPPGKKSMAFTLRFQRKDRTLVDGEVDAATEHVIAELTNVFGAHIRRENLTMDS